ncbi:hypothetical protein ACP26L_01420 [Paenibacillus sp. S-38]|uniref:hypothetical protein n=1 Tax=Paenibacillus sp. S-38 TaxID=3416710 RepID=UPI003CF524FE
MRKVLQLILPFFLLSILLVACNEKNPDTLSLEHGNIKFVSINSKNGYDNTITDSKQISTIINAVEKANKTDEVLNPVTPNRTPEEDYSLTIYYDPAVKHDALQSFFVWVDKTGEVIKIAPIQKGTTYLYKLNFETSEELNKLGLFN